MIVGMRVKANVVVDIKTASQNQHVGKLGSPFKY